LNKSYKILISPLEWGLGHASRMIPLASKLQQMGNDVFIASGKEHLSLFKSEVPGLTYIHFPGFKPGYSRLFPQYLVILFKIPVLIFHIVSEHQRLKKIIRENAIDIVISDNRFGLWNSTITSVYLTHMPLIPFPSPFKFMEPVGVALHRKIIRKYSLCFIPDLPGDINLSGRLSHGIKLPDNVRYIGILSKFTTSENLHTIITKGYHHNTVILSGPEPQKGILKQKLIPILRENEIPAIIFEGKPENRREIAVNGNITFYSHLPAQEMRVLIESSNNLITRSGYTTIMELVSLNCRALIIPTPGQTEQEYLAIYLSEKGWFDTISQGKIKKGMIISTGKPVFPDSINQESRVLLNAALNEMLEKSHKESQT